MISNKDSYLILMADGNIEDHNIVKRAFRDSGVNHVFNSVYNGRQLLDHFLLKGAYSREDDVQPDIVIMEMQLDLIDGLEVLRFLSENSKKFKMPVYVLTKNKNEEDMIRAKKLGVRDYIQKPATIEQYVKIIQQICRENIPAARIDKLK